ncbi:hypothetical protein RQP46_004505 [Phenoliferia psychrophenolica]
MSPYMSSMYGMYTDAFSTLGGNAGNTVACPGNNGAYHSGDPAAATVDYSLLGGCALAISDTTDIAAVTKDNLAVFSVQKECVWQRNTVFNVPAAMPPCTGAYCICAWLWEPQNGTGNYYQTPFRCDVTGSPIGATPIQTPLVDPTYCGDGSACTTGAKRPIFYYNLDYSNVVWQGNYLRPGYHATWSFNDGAQNDIFMSSAQAAVYKPTVASTSAAPAATTYPKSTDLAIGATASASSVAAGSPASAANDGVIGGYYNTNGADTGNDAAEWSSNGEGVGAWLLLTWTNAVTISQVVVYDRPNLDDHCLAFTLTFGDGSVQTFGNMNNDGSATAVTIATISTSTLKWTCTAVSAHTSNVGLSEFQRCCFLLRIVGVGVLLRFSGNLGSGRHLQLFSSRSTCGKQQHGHECYHCLKCRGQDERPRFERSCQDERIQPRNLREAVELELLV